MKDDIQAQRNKRRYKKSLNDQSWNLESFHAESDIVISAYVYDPFDTGKIALASFTENDLGNLSSFDASVEMEELSGAVDHYFKLYAEAAPAKIRECSEALGVAIGLYMVNTKNYKLLREAQDDRMRHFIILLYRNRHTGESTTRPFGLFNSEIVLHADAIKHIAKPIIERDEAVNPGYFNVSPVVPIRS